MKNKIIAVIGAGGKTTLIHRLAEEYRRKGASVLVSTTTHMLVEPDTDLSCDSFAVMEKIKKTGYCMAGAVCPENSAKMQSLPEQMLHDLMKQVDYALIEADGAKHYPFKVPAEHEPVIYQITTHILIVESMQAFNHPLSEVCFRLEKAQEILNQADCREKLLTPEIVAKLLEKGYLEKLTGSLSNSKRKIGVIFNQQDSQTFEEKLSVPVIYEKKLEMPEKKKFFLIMLASGFSRRFGGNKLIYSMEKTPMYQILMEKLDWVRQHSEHVAGVCVVSQYERIRKSAEEIGRASCRERE